MKTEKERLYYLDWLRIILIFSVFLFHIGMVFNGMQWSVKNNETIPFLDPIMEFLTLWRMPLLFMVSGIGTYLALGRRTELAYFKERTVRLFIPLVVGVLTLNPIQVYFERKSLYTSFGEFYRELFNGLYPIGNFSTIHHLWFIKHLFLISILVIPLLHFIRSESYSKFQNNLKDFLSRNPFLINVIPLGMFLFWRQSP